MKNAIDIIESSLRDNSLDKCVFSGPRNKSSELRGIIIVKLKESEKIKVEFRFQKHNDIKTLDTETFLEKELTRALESFKQIHIKLEQNDIQILINKNLKAKVITSKKSVDTRPVKHNKDKNYLIPDGEPCLFLIEIGVMDKSGKVKSNYYKKFRQINRFLELVDDLYKNEDHKSLHIVDFGCGKSYLTFALYHYFHNIKKTNAKITGIDLKQEVIDHCNQIATTIGYSELKFAHGFIHDFKTDDPVDFVVTLHACDTATDDAILFSLRNRAKKMMFVPCCQHELNKQIENSESSIMLKHGIFRDRMCSLVTDTMRTQLLEASGFKVQSMEFIDLEHTAKNILLRCVAVNRSEGQTKAILEKYDAFKKQWNIAPYLEKQMRSDGLLAQ
jgi:SAM-dependent methyltransferase